LYNANARLISLDLTDRVDSWIAEGLLPGFTNCFLPYRDDGDNVFTEEDYFNADVNAINTSVGIIGFLDGATFDSGCGWEIGYGYSKGYPIHLITTDFLRWYAGSSTECYHISKLTQHVATVVAVWNENQSISSYRQRQVDILEQAFTAFRINLINDFNRFVAPKVPLEPLPILYDYYLDPNFDYTEPSQMLLREIENAITQAGKTFVLGDNMGDIEADITNLRQSGQAIFFSDVFEPNIDSAILHGIAYGIGRKPIVYCSKKQRFHSEVADDYLSGMIRYSAAVVRSLAELKALVSAL
jgi:nucleoside 2-deoxyribosyltransferase